MLLWRLPIEMFAVAQHSERRVRSFFVVECPGDRTGVSVKSCSSPLCVCNTHEFLRLVNTTFALNGSCMFRLKQVSYLETFYKNSRKSVDCVWNVMAHVQKPDFVFQRNGRVHLNRQGRQFSRLLAVEVCVSAVVMLDTPCSEVVRRVLATHCISEFPPSLPLPCVTVCHHVSTGLYFVQLYLGLRSQPSLRC